MARVRGAAASTELSKKAGGGKFLTLEDGDEFEVAFLGVIKHGLEGDDAEPLGIEVVWLDGPNGRYSVEYDPNEHTEDDMRVQFAWNVLVRAEDKEDGSPGEDEVKIFQQGPRFFKDWIRQKDKKGYDYWFTLGHEGSGQFDTKYSLDREDKIDDDELADLKKYELHDLEKELFRDREEQKDKKGGKRNKKARSGRARATDASRTAAKSNGANGSSNGVISDTVAAELRQSIKDLPDAHTVMDKFKSKFEVGKLKELPSDKEVEARAWLSALSQTAPEPEKKQEVDPFE